MSPSILYLGPAGTHSHEAAWRRFGVKARLVPCLSHYDIFAQLCAASSRTRPLAIVPVENSSEGPVTQTLDQLADHPQVTILDSFSLPVQQHLLAPPGLTLATVRRVCSHPQALGQCRDTLARLLPRAELVPDSSCNPLINNTIGIPVNHKIIDKLSNTDTMALAAGRE